MSNNSIFDLFPVPSNPPSVTSPGRSPGITPGSTKALREVLKVNHDKWDMFFDDIGRHNHISHAVLAYWAMGAHEEIIKASYDKNTVLQRPMPPKDAVEPITKENFNDHLAGQRPGDGTYFSAYMEFFTEVIKQKGMGAALEEYIFSSKANFGSTDSAGKHPEMLNRFFASIMHPIIHAGYGVEFGLPGIMIEALAQTALTPKESSPIYPEDFFNFALKTVNEDPKQAKPSVHAFDLVARILKDSKYVGPEAPTLPTMWKNFIANEEITKSLNELVSLWTVNGSDPKEVESKIEELQWLAVLLYGVPGIDTPGVKFNADFTNLHIVTASLFLQPLASCLSPTSKVLLLRGYLIIELAWWIANSRPRLDIASFFAADTANPLPSGPFPTPHADALPSPTSPIATTGNAWLPLIQHTITHPDDHYAKLMRALAHYSVLYGSRDKGHFAGTELEGAELLDGTLFIRAAGLTMSRVSEKKANALLVYFDFIGYWENRK